MLASIFDAAQNVGYPLLFVLVMAESSGVPVPGETALITAAVLASQGRLQIEWVIAIAAAGAIIGDNIGYVIGRKGGRWLLERPGMFHSQRLNALESGERFFEKHGPKAVFFGRFLLGLRVWASWLAGATRMYWRSFAFWNACGGICWATITGLAGYFLGHAAGNAIQSFGLFGLAGVLAIVIAFVVWHRRHRRHAATLAQAQQDAEHAQEGLGQQADTHSQPRDAEGQRGEGPRGEGHAQRSDAQAQAQAGES